MEEIIDVSDDGDKQTFDIEHTGESTTGAFSCPFCPFLVESHDQLAVLQEHVENVHLSFQEKVCPSSSFFFLVSF